MLFILADIGGGWLLFIGLDGREAAAVCSLLDAVSVYRQADSSTPSRCVARQPPQVGEQVRKVGEADPLASLGVLERRAPRAAWPITPQPQQSGVIVRWSQLVRIRRLHRLHPHAIRGIMSATTSRCSYE